MIKFMIGCILISLTMFFGGKEILANYKNIENRTNTLNSQIQKNQMSLQTQARFAGSKNNAILYSDDLVSNLKNQLSIKDSKQSFVVSEFSNPNKVLSEFNYSIEGFASFSDIFTFMTDIQTIVGIQLDDICFGCEIKSDGLLKGDEDLSFKIKGKLYVYKPEN